MKHRQCKLRRRWGSVTARDTRLANERAANGLPRSGFFQTPAMGHGHDGENHSAPTACAHPTTNPHHTRTSHVVLAVHSPKPVVQGRKGGDLRGCDRTERPWARRAFKAVPRTIDPVSHANAFDPGEEEISSDAFGILARLGASAVPCPVVRVMPNSAMCVTGELVKRQAAAAQKVCGERLDADGPLCLTGADSPWRWKARRVHILPPMRT